MNRIAYEHMQQETYKWIKEKYMINGWTDKLVAIVKTGGKKIPGRFLI